MMLPFEIEITDFRNLGWR